MGFVTSTKYPTQSIMDFFPRATFNPWPKIPFITLVRITTSTRFSEVAYATVYPGKHQTTGDLTARVENSTCPGQVIISSTSIIVFFWNVIKSENIVNKRFFFSYLFYCFCFSPRGVGRSWRYCNTRPTRGRGRASPGHSAVSQKSD